MRASKSNTETRNREVKTAANRRRKFKCSFTQYIRTQSLALVSAPAFTRRLAVLVRPFAEAHNRADSPCCRWNKGWVQHRFILQQLSHATNNKIYQFAQFYKKQAHCTTMVYSDKIPIQHHINSSFELKWWHILKIVLRHPDTNAGDWYIIKRTSFVAFMSAPRSRSSFTHARRPSAAVRINALSLSCVWNM